MADYGTFDPKKKIQFKEGDTVTNDSQKFKANAKVEELKKNYDLNNGTFRYYFGLVEDKEVPPSKDNTVPIKEKEATNLNPKVTGNTGLAKIGHACSALREVVGLLSSGEYTEKVSIDLNYNSAQKDQNDINTSNRVFQTKVVNINLTGNNNFTPLHMSGLKNPFGHMMGGRSVSGSLNIVTNDPDTIINLLSLFRSNSIHDIANNMISTARGLMAGKKAVVPDLAVTNEALRSGSFDNYSKRTLQSFRVARRTMKSEQFIKFLEEQFKTQSKTGLIDDLYYDHPEPLIIYGPLFNSFGYKSFVPTTATIQTLAGSPGHVSIVLNVSWVDNRFVMKEALRFKKNIDEAYTDKAIAWYNTINKSAIENIDEISNNGADLRKRIISEYDKRQTEKIDTERNIKESITNAGTFYSTAPVLASYALSRFKEYLELKLANVPPTTLKDDATPEEIAAYLDYTIEEQIAKDDKLPGINSSISPWKVTGKIVAGGGLEIFTGIKAASYIAKGTLAGRLGGILLEVGGPILGSIIVEGLDNTSNETFKQGEPLIIRDAIDKADLNLIPLTFPLTFDKITEYSDTSRNAYFLNINLPQLMGKEYLNFLMETMDNYTDVPKLDAKIKSWSENAMKLMSAPIKHAADPKGFTANYTAAILNNETGDCNTGFYSLVTNITKNGISKTIRIILCISSEIYNTLYSTEGKGDKSAEEIKNAYIGLNSDLSKYFKGTDFDIKKDESKENAKTYRNQLINGVLIKTSINAHGIVSTLNNVPMNQINLYFQNITLYDRQFYRAATFANITLNGLHELVELLPMLEENYGKLSPYLNDKKQSELQGHIIKFRHLIGKNLKSFNKEDRQRVLKRAKTLIAYGNNYQYQVEDEHEINNCLFGLSKILIQEFIKESYYQKLEEYLDAKTDSDRENTFYYKGFILPYNLPRFGLKMGSVLEEVWKDFKQPLNVISVIIGVVAIFFAGWIAAIIGVLAILIGAIPFIITTFSQYIVNKIGDDKAIGQFENIIKAMPTPLIGNSILLRMAQAIYDDQLNYIPNEIYPPDIIPTDGMSNIQDIDTYLAIPLRYYASTKKTMHPGFWIWTQKDSKLSQMLDQSKVAMFINHANKIDNLYPTSKEDIAALAEASANQVNQMNLPGDDNNIFLFLKRVIGLTFIAEIEKWVELYKKDPTAQGKTNCLNDKTKLEDIINSTYSDSKLIFNSLFTQGLDNGTNTTQAKDAKLFGNQPTSGCINYELTGQEYKTGNSSELTEPIIVPIINVKDRQTSCLYFKFKIDIKYLYKLIMKYEKVEIRSDIVPIDYSPSTEALIRTIEKSSLIDNNLLPFINSSVRDLEVIQKGEEIETLMIKTWRDSNLTYNEGVFDKNTTGLTLANLIEANNKRKTQAPIATNVAKKLRSSGIDFNGLVLYNMFKGDLSNEESLGKLIHVNINKKSTAREIAKRNISKMSLANIRLQRQFLQTNTGAFGEQGLDLINNRFQEILDKETFNTYGEKASKMNPVFKLYFLQENKKEWLMVDDYYSYSGVESFSIHQTVESPIYTAEIVLSNFTNNLGNLFADRINRENPFFHASESSSQVNSIMLKPGCKLKIYLGYGVVLTEDDCVFCGKIDEMQGDQIKKIICTSHGALLMENYAEDNVVKMGYSYFALADQKNIYSLQSYMIRRLLVTEFLKNSNDIASGRLSENGQIVGSSSFESDTFEPQFNGVIQSAIAGIEMSTLFSFFQQTQLIDLAGLGTTQATQFLGGLKNTNVNTANIGENIRIWNTPINETYYAAFNKQKASGKLNDNDGEVGKLKAELKRNILMETDGSISQWVLNANKYINTNTFVDFYDKLVNAVKKGITGEYKETDQWLAHNETYWESLQEMLLQLPNHVCTVRPFDERNTIVVTDRVRGYYRFTRKVYSSEIKTNNIISQLEGRLGINIESIDMVMNNLLRDDNDSVALFILFYIYAGRTLNYIGSSSSGATFFSIPTENQVSHVIDKLNGMISENFDPKKETLFGFKAELEELEIKRNKYREEHIIMSSIDDKLFIMDKEIEKVKQKIKTLEQLNTTNFGKNTKNENPTVVARRRLLASMFDESLSSELNTIDDKKFIEVLIGSGKNFAIIDNNIDAFTSTKDGSISNEIADQPLSTKLYNNYSAACAIMEACGNIVTWAVSNAYMRSSSHRKLSENHYKSNGTDIISNEINLSKAFNSVEMTLVEDPDDYEDIVLGNKQGTTNTFKTSSYLKYLNTYRTFVKNAYSSETIDAKKANFSMGVNLLTNVLRETYNGQLILLGDASIKEWDCITIFDQMSDMYGFFEVKEVTHIYNKMSGFISVVTPQLPAYNDYAVNPGPARSAWEYVGGILKIIALGSVIAYTGKKGIKHLKGAGKAGYNVLLGSNFVKQGAAERAAKAGQKWGAKLTGDKYYDAIAHPVASFMKFTSTNKASTYILKKLDTAYLKVKIANIDDNIKQFTNPIAEVLDTANTKAIKNSYEKLLENPNLSAEQIADIKVLQKEYDQHLKGLQDTYMESSGIYNSTMKEMESIRKYTKSKEFRDLPPEAKEEALAKETQRLWKKSIDDAPKDKKKIIEALNDESKKFREDHSKRLKEILNKKGATPKDLPDEQKTLLKNLDAEAETIKLKNKPDFDRVNSDGIRQANGKFKGYDFDADIATLRNTGDTRPEAEIIIDIKKTASDRLEESQKTLNGINEKIADIKGTSPVDTGNAINETDEIVKQFDPSNNQFTEEILKDTDTSKIGIPKWDVAKMSPEDNVKLDEAISDYDILHPENLKKIKAADIKKMADDQKYENMAEEIYRKSVTNKKYIASEVLGLDPNAGTAKNAANAALTLVGLKGGTKGLAGVAAMWGLYSLFDGILDTTSSGFTGIISEYYGQNAVTVSGLISKGEPFIANLDGMQKKNFKTTEFANPLEVGKARFRRGIEVIEEEIGEFFDSGNRAADLFADNPSGLKEIVRTGD